VDGHHLIPSPFWPLSPAPRSERRAARVNQLRLEAARRSLVFPIVGRLQHGKSIAISVIGLVAAAAWLALLWSQTANIEPFPWVRAVVFPAFMLGCAFWSWRFMKTIVLVQDFLKTLRKLMRRFAPGNSVAAWTKIIGRNRDDRIHNLQSLLFTDRPKVNDARLREKRIALDEVQQALRSTHVLIAAADVAAAEEDVVAQHLILYVRQFFVHAKSLGIGLCTSGILLFLAANSFPFNSQPLMQLTTSLMLVAIGSMVVWYYVQFDRNEIISLIVGSTPHHVEWNWSLLQTVVPAGGLALVALLSQAFPEMWHWLRDLLGPVMRTSG